MRLNCPHCDSLATIRSSKQLGTTVREASVQCNNVECAHTWITRIVADRTIAPSMQPNPKVYIPLSTRSPANQPATGNQLELGMTHPPPRMATG
ncbi:MAG: ogr/Delta-like zinc finger family protein [Candidatus Competibacter phosphatis]